MKRNENFLLRQVAGKQVVVPVGKAAAEFPGMITLNDTGAFLWELLQTEQTMDSLAAAVTEKYEVSAETALEDTKKFVEKLFSVGAIE